jgi:hypothetical protein
MSQKSASVKLREMLLDILEREDDEDVWPHYSCDTSAEEKQTQAQVDWNEQLSERIKRIEECLRRGRHETETSQGKYVAGEKYMVLMACKCGAQGRAIIESYENPPKEWT